MRRTHLFFFMIFLGHSLFGQPFFPDEGHIYRTDVIPRMDITIDEDTLQWIYENVESMNEFKALFVFTAGGIVDTVDNIGFRLRGNTSRQSVKKSFKVSFNTYTPGGKFYGIEKMNLNGEHNDPSIIRSYLTWNLFRQMKVPAPRSNHVKVYINGRYYGLYINVEHIDEELMESRFGNKMGNLYKCLYPANLTYLGNNKDDYKGGYELKTNREADNYDDLIHFISVLDNSTPEQLPEKVEPVFNMNGFLRYLAVEIFTGHWDGYSYLMNNYYLFNNMNTGRFEFIPYDTDNTFGIDWFGIDWGSRNIYSWWKADEDRPLTSKIFGNQVYRDRFSFFLNELITEYVDTIIFFPEIDARKSAIDASVETDVYRTGDYGWTYNDYNRSYTEALGSHAKYGLKPYITTRLRYIREQLVLNPISPIIENVNYSFPQILQPIQIELTITDDQANPTGKLFYKINDGTFNTVNLTQVSENGYRATIPGLTDTGEVKFYLEATDAGNNITREPSVGEYILTIGVSDPELMITEFMSSNNNTIVDNYGATEDWIEIRNVSNSAVSLEGKYLTDDLSRRNRFELPAVSLEPGQFYLVWADDDREQGVNHANFKLDAGGESIGLFDSYENSFAPVHTLTYQSQETNVSGGMDASGNIITQSFITPGGENNSADVAFITFRFNMNKQIQDGNFFPSSGFLDVAGTFNEWNGDDRIYDGNSDGIYQYTAFGFAAGETIEYKARINADWSTAEFPELGAAGNRVYTLTPGHNIIEHWYDDRIGTGFTKEMAEVKLSVFPNPSPSGDFLVEANFNLELVCIYSTAGELLARKEIEGLNKIHIHAKLNKGLYMVKVVGSDREFISKLIVY